MKRLTLRDRLLCQTLIRFCSGLLGELTQARGVLSGFPQECLFVGTTHGKPQGEKNVISTALTK